MRLLVTRPADESQALAERLQARGHEASIEPLLTITPDLFAPLSLDGVQALLFTSANGVRAFALRSPRRDLPVYAVGPATAAAAREIGCVTVESAGGDVGALAALAATRLDPEKGPVLHVAGQVVAGDLAGLLAARGLDVRRAALYAAEPSVRLSAATRDALVGGRLDGVLLFSPRSASTFAAVTAAPELRAALSRLTLFALSPAVAAAADLGWRRVAVAATPDEDALLALVDAPAGAEPMEGTKRMSEAKPARGMEGPAAPDSAAPTSASLWPLLLVGLVAIAALALDLRVLLTAPGRDAAQAARESVARDRVDRLEREIVALQPARGAPEAAAERDRRVETQLSALAAALDGLGGRVDALDRDLRAETARAAAAAAAATAAVAALQSAAPPGSEPKPAAEDGAAAAALAPLVEDMRRLRAEIEALRAPAIAAAPPPPPPPPQAVPADTPAAAIAALRAALAGGATPAQALVPLRDRIAAHPSLTSPLARLEGALAAAPADLAALRAAFPAQAAAALRAARQDQPPAAWWAPIAATLQSLVAIRRVGERAGEDDEALLARAEQRLVAGDTAAALALLARLSPAAAAPLAPWIGRAQALEARDAALAELLRAAGATP